MYKCVHTYGDGGVLDYTTQYKEGLTITTNSLGHQTYYFHDERSLIYKIIDENGGITHQHYNDDEELEVYVSPQGICEKYSYDDYGNLTKVTYDNGDSTQYTYDKRQNLISLQTPGRKQVFMQYDKYDRVVMRMIGTEQVQHYEYMDKYLWKITDEKNHSWHLFYNERHHELTQLTYPNELFAQRQYDVRGNVKSERDTTGMWTKCQYDNANNVIKLEEANGNTHQFAYDSSYNITHTQDDTHNIAFDYGSLGVLLRRTQNGRRVNFAYDNELQLNRISNERNEQYRFHLDPTGQVISE